MKDGRTSPGIHPFVRSPHQTFLRMSFPVLFSLIAEPVTGLVDTAFVSRLGTVPLAALGVGTMVLSSLFWVFNFLGIGTQTEVAQALGRKDMSRERQIAWLSIFLAATLGFLSIMLFFPAVSMLSKLMGADGDVHLLTVQYLKIRLLGAPAVLMYIAAFRRPPGAFGHEDAIVDRRFHQWFERSFGCPVYFRGRSHTANGCFRCGPGQRHQSVDRGSVGYSRRSSKIAFFKAHPFWRN